MQSATIAPAMRRKGTGTYQNTRCQNTCLSSKRPTRPCGSPSSITIALRVGFPETVYCSGKTPEQVTAIVGHLAQRHDHVLATRATPEHAEITLQQVPRARYRAIARAITVRPDDDPPGKTGVVLLSAGTADLPVAEEALLTASMMGQDVEV